MPRAGFYAIHNSHIRFGRDGCWYADGQLITNPRIALLFSQHVQRAADGSYLLRIADERAAIEVDDTPYVVTGADVDAAGEVWIELNDRSREVLAPDTLRVGADDVLYCTVKGGAEPARFLRPAYYQLAAHLKPGEAGGVVFASPRGTFAIGPR